jgi:thioesterase domain-containing protein
MNFNLQDYIDQHIPITGAMGFTVVQDNTDGLRLRAPLSANINDKGTGFAGSIFSVAVLSAWSFATSLLARHDISADVAVVSSQANYLRPVTAEFEAHCPAPGAEAIDTLLASVASRGRGRLALEAKVYCGGEVVLEFTGNYAIRVRAAT